MEKLKNYNCQNKTLNIFFLPEIIEIDPNTKPQNIYNQINAIEGFSNLIMIPRNKNKNEMYPVVPSLL